MKQWCSCILSCLLALGSFAQFDDYVEENPIEQVKQGPTFVFKTNPLSVISGEIPFFTSEYRALLEYIPDYKSSYSGGVSLFTMGPILKAALNQDTAFQNANFTAKDFALLGYRIQLGYRLYPIGMINKSVIDGTFPPKGLFLFGLVSYSDARLFLRSNRGNQIQFSHFSLSGNVGYQFVFDDVFTLDLYFGAGYKNNQVNEVSRTNTRVITNQFGDDLFIYNNHLKVNFGVNLGFVF